MVDALAIGGRHGGVEDFDSGTWLGAAHGDRAIWQHSHQANLATGAFIQVFHEGASHGGAWGTRTRQAFVRLEDDVTEVAGGTSEDR